MIFIAKLFRKTFYKLFINKKHKFAVIGVILIGSSISITELAVAKLFTKIVLHEKTMSESKAALWIAAFFIAFGLTRAGHFAQRLFRINYFEKVFDDLKLNRDLTKTQENWMWTLAIELSGVLSAAVQLILLATFFSFFSPLFTIINLIVIFLIFEVFSRLLIHQIAQQREFVKARKEKNPAASALQVKTRIRSGELGQLLSSFGIMLLLAVLLYLSYKNGLSASNTIVLFLGIRMQSSNLNNISTGLMRFARALANSE
ncbi:MAG: hypothetical protein RLZ57_1019 [Actinomycetota bacterium]|jgi:methyl-accepting chemotaxis protein